MTPRQRRQPTTPSEGGNGHTIERASGVRIPSKYLTMPGVRTTAFDPPPADLLRCFFVGEVGQGKSTLVCSRPNTAIFDFSRKTSGIAATAPGCAIFGNHEPGQEPWSLAKFDEVFEALIQDAQAGNRPFTGIAIDELGSLCQLVMEAFTATYLQERKDPKKPWQSFADYGADGAGYGKMNSWMVTRLARLTNVGYGLIVVAHKKLKVVEMDDGTVLQFVKVEGNPGVVKWLDEKCEYSGTIERRRSVERVKQEVSAGGRNLSRNVTHESWNHVLDLDYSTGAGPKATTRQHLPMIDTVISLPEGSGWEAFTAAYDAAVTARRNTIQ